MSEPAPLLPMSPLASVKSSKKDLPPISVKSPLPPLTKKDLPPISVKSALPPLTKKQLPPISVKSPLPPLTKKELPPISVKSPLPPLTKKELPSLTTKKDLTSPLAKDIKENRKEIIEEISLEVKEKEDFQKGVKSLLPKVPEETQKLMKPLKPLASIPVLPKEKAPSMPTLKISQEGVEKAKLTEPEASFQPKSLLPPSLPPLPGIPVDSPSLATIVSPANLPTKKSKDKTPKIRIPKIKSSMVKPSPKKRKEESSSEIILPSGSTVIPPIPVKSPTATKISNVKKAQTGSDDLIKNIMGIDVTKLKSGRAKNDKKDSSYSVNDLKAIAGSLNLTKTGKKAELVERIKQAILKVNPAAFD